MTDSILSDSMVPLFSFGAVCFGLAAIYSIYITYKTYSVLKSVTHMVILYNNIMITTIPLLMYFIKILDYRFTIIGGYITDVYLNHYYIEWLFTTPLILMQFAIVGNLGIYRLLGLVTMDILMILCGYMSYIVSDYETKKTLFAIGCLNFLAISAGTLYGPQQGLKRTAQCVLCLWTLYPVIHFMYLLHHIQIYSVVFIFTMLDILVKGIVLNGTLSLYYFPVIYQQLP